jgi:serine/threonine protein kinase
MTNEIYPDALPLQYRLNTYLLERVLGRGGFGITYLARDTSLDKHVAIKEYLPVEVAKREDVTTVRPRIDSQRDLYGWGLERFIVEARTLARFDHPSIVRVHTLFEANGTAYMVMRFEEGDNLATLLERRGTIPEEKLLAILLPILDGLELVHNARFIHRDIKPDNIQIRVDGTPVLLDFGSARQAIGKPRTMTVLVAHGYAPFEQYDGNAENQGPWTDIYGLGATCYRAIAGVAPIDAIARVRNRLGSASDALVPATVIGKGRYSERLLAGIDAALQFAEKDRPQTIAEWRKQIAGDRAPATPAEPKAAENVPQAPPPQRLRAKIIWTVAGAAAAAGVAGLLIAISLSSDRAHERQQIEDLKRQFEEQRKRAEQTPPQELRNVPPSPAPVPKKPNVARGDSSRKVPKAEPIPLARSQPQPQERKENPSETPPVVVPKPPEPVTEMKLAEAKPAEVKPSAASLLEAAGRADARGDYEAASRIYKSLADTGNPQAQVKLGEMYEKGHGFAQNEATAASWYRKAANQGDGAAEYKLGDMHASGRGVPQNYNQAYIWYSLALRSGMSAAEAPRKKAAAMLQPAEINQADRVVDSWQKAPGK